jgi:hypothetical protein
MSPAEKAHRDALNAAVCAGIDRSWSGNCINAPCLTFR